MTLEDAKNAVMSQLIPSYLEISVSGNFVVNDLPGMILQYLGTVPANANSQFKVEAEGEEMYEDFSGVPALVLPSKHLDLELEDSDRIAMAYVAVAASNTWGFLADGSTVTKKGRRRTQTGQ